MLSQAIQSRAGVRLEMTPSILLAVQGYFTRLSPHSCLFLGWKLSGKLAMYTYEKTVQIGHTNLGIILAA